MITLVFRPQSGALSTETYTSVSEVVDRLAALYSQNPRIFRGDAALSLHGVTGDDQAVEKIAYLMGKLYEGGNLAQLRKEATDLIARPISLFDYYYEVGRVNYGTIGPIEQQRLDSLVSQGKVKRPR